MFDPDAGAGAEDPEPVGALPEAGRGAAVPPALLDPALVCDGAGFEAVALVLLPPPEPVLPLDDGALGAGDGLGAGAGAGLGAVELVVIPGGFTPPTMDGAKCSAFIAAMSCGLYFTPAGNMLCPSQVALTCWAYQSSGAGLSKPPQPWSMVA
ncbi:MAG: hypothetical protein K6V97_11215 [Actinomycetia bacterium]|nr:hypothetical protein [Actinomycetes bacterium]